MCEYCEGRKKYLAEYKGDGILTALRMINCLLGADEDADEVAYIEGGIMFVDNSDGEYAELGFKINFCPNCGMKIKEETE